MLDALKIAYDYLLQEPEYNNQRLNHPAAAIAFETYVAQVLAGNLPELPKIRNGYFKALVRFASEFTKNVVPVPDPTPAPDPEPYFPYRWVFPTNIQNRYHSGGGLDPVKTLAGNGYIYEIISGPNPDNISRSFWNDSGVGVGTPWRTKATMLWEDTVFGAVMRVENFNPSGGDYVDMNQIELARYESGVWNVVANLWKPVTGDPISIVLIPNVPIPDMGPVTIELRGILGLADGEALTEIWINGVRYGSTTRKNWWNGLLDRIRYGFVDGTNTVKGKLVMTDMRFG